VEHPDLAGVLERVQVAPDRHLGDVELPGKVVIGRKPAVCSVERIHCRRSAALSLRKRASIISPEFE
jgi:hypothetical protein